MYRNQIAENVIGSMSSQNKDSQFDEEKFEFLNENKTKNMVNIALQYL